MKTTLSQWLVYCRPGFERDCVEETQARAVEAATNSGYVVLQGKPRLRFSDLAFTRQLIRLHTTVDNLLDRDRLTPLLSAVPEMPEKFGALWLEVADTNAGKTLSGFTRRFRPLLEEKLRVAGQLLNDTSLPRLHIFFPDKSRALIGTSDPRNSAATPMGILRLKMPHDAPSRSYLKLAEALEVFLTKEQQQKWLRAGMHAVDLGAAPGGWTWQLVQHGLKVMAVDNGPLKGGAAEHPHIKHLRQDGFRYRPKKPVDWLVCDMVERPQRVAALVAEWVASGLATRAIFNLKLPMKKRVVALHNALDIVRNMLDAKGMRYELQARQLYHDREEVTVFLAKAK